MQAACCYKQVSKKLKKIKQIEVKTILGKSQPNFQLYVKKNEAEAKKWSSFKTTCILFYKLKLI